jgi:hypothetical protein
MATSRISRFALGACLIAGSALATSAQAVIPIYPNPGVQNPTSVATFTAGNTGYVRTWFLGRGGAAFTVRLGAIVNGVDRGLGLNNQTSALGELFNYGAINAGDTLRFYIFVQDTGQTWDTNPANNSDGVNHAYFQINNYFGGDFGVPLNSTTRRGSYFGFEDLDGGGDFNYQDLQFALRLGAIPEPATWAMMILGFGMIGGAMRRRRAVRPTVRVAYS